MLQPNADAHPFLSSVARCIDQRTEAEVKAALEKLDEALPIVRSVGLNHMSFLWERYRDEVVQELRKQVERRICTEVADRLVQPWGQPSSL